MQIAAYGSCLNNKQKLGRTGRPAEDLLNEQRILGKHKFYLAFENSCCVDYISEKLASAFASGLIPVVAGPEDYSRLAYRLPVSLVTHDCVLLQLCPSKSFHH